MRKIELTDRIEVQDEQGVRFLVDEYTTYTSFQATDGPLEWFSGMKSYEVDGADCNLVDKSTFQTLDKKLLRRVQAR